MKRRRGPGEGSIFERKDGRWQAYLTLPDGKRKNFYAPTYSAARDKLLTANSAQQQGILATGPGQTLGTFLNWWLENVAQHTVRPSTYDGYRRWVVKHILPALGKVRLQNLTAQELQRFYSRKLSEGLSERSAQYLHAILHRALTFAVRQDLIARNPTDLVDAPRPRRYEIAPLDPREAILFLKTAWGDRLYALYVLALTTGLRQGELLGLRWADVDLQAASLHVRQQLSRVPGQGMKFVEPKTVKGRRQVALPAVAVEALRLHRKAQLEERLFAGSAWEDVGLIFCNSRGRPLERPNLTQRSFRPLLTKAGLPQIRFHDLRHSAATLLLFLGINPKVVQERLGHATIGMTLDVYSHVVPDMQRQAAGKIDDLFASLRSPSDPETPKVSTKVSGEPAV
ncbi:MAG: site-specific integrase [Chloroflexota bacterium]